MYITTAGVGAAPRGRRLHYDQVRPGDLLIISGTIADHGLAVMLAREMPQVQSVLRSDVAPLNHLIEPLLEAVNGVTFMRDPTRGGLAGVVCELAARTGLHVCLDEAPFPPPRDAPRRRHARPGSAGSRQRRQSAHRRPPGSGEAALNALRSNPLGAGAVVVGRVEEDRDGICELRTTMGGRRILQKPYGEQLPRIC